MELSFPQQTHRQTVHFFISELGQSIRSHKQTSVCVWSNNTHEHMTASWRPQGQTQSHMNFSYLHIINHSVLKLNFCCLTHVLLVVELLHKMQLYFPGRTQSPVSCYLLSEGESFSKSLAVNSSWRLNDKQWAGWSERTEQSLWNTECVQTVFSCQCVSLMCNFLLAWRACSRSPGM